MLCGTSRRLHPTSINPFTPKSDQCQTSPTASPEILHHTVGRTWLSIAYSNKRRNYTHQSLITWLIHFFSKGWDNVYFFELGSERVKLHRLSRSREATYSGPFHSWEWSMSKFPRLTRNMTSYSMENLTFHSLLRWKVIILQILATSLIQSLFERLGEYTFWAQEWKG